MQYDPLSGEKDNHKRIIVNWQRLVMGHVMFSRPETIVAI